MYNGLVHFPNIDTTPIEQIRQVYDPTFHLIAAHITVMFPVPNVVGEAALTAHIEQVVKHWTPFPIRIQGFHKSWDHWLLLILSEGNSQLIELHSQLYKGILAPYHRQDLEFVPHLSLGLFVKELASYEWKDPQALALDETRYEQALSEAKALKMDFGCVMDGLQLVTLSNDFSQIHLDRHFPFTKTDV